MGVRREWRVEGADTLPPLKLVQSAVPFVVAVLYGAVVLGASWAGEGFTTAVERGLWRGAGGVLLMIAMVGGALRAWSTRKVGEGRWVAGVVHGLCWFSGVVYVVAKGYVLAEVFAGLRSAPEGMWDGVGGVVFVPHVGQ